MCTDILFLINVLNLLDNFYEECYMILVIKADSVSNI